MACIFLLRLVSFLKTRRQKKFISKWQDHIFNYLYSTENPLNLISRIPKSKYKYLFSYLRTFLFNLKGDDLNRLKQLITETSLREYFFNKLDKLSTKDKVEASYFLRYINTEETINLLVKKLNSPNKLIFRTAVESLAYLNAYEKINLIIDIAKKRKNLTSDSILSIILRFDKSICPILTERLDTEKSTHILLVIITVLWHFKYAEALKKILNILFFSGDKYLIIESLRYLGEVENLDSVNALRFFLGHSKPEIRVAAIEAVGKIGDTSLEDYIMSKMLDPEIEVKIAAAKAMYKCSIKTEYKLLGYAKNPLNQIESIIARRIIMEKRILEND
ncbi:MAG: HEAT repeat domain-containing protein [Ignavibacteriales bacterium]|nr:HEAT repeat domain-containing protein [Ignavibacteriales bacterium]